MSVASDPIRRLSDLSSTAQGMTAGSAQKLLFVTFLLPIITFFDKAAEAVSALMDMFIVPVNSLIDGLGQLILAMIGGAASIIGAGAEASAEAFLFGIWSALGPAAYPAAYISVLSGAYILVRYTMLDETSDLIPFSMTDFPFIGADEEET